MDRIALIDVSSLSHGSMAVIAVVGIVALLIATKVGHAILKLILGLMGIAALAAAVWWFFLRH